MLNIGILGTARIARAFPGRPFRNAHLSAIASRDKSKADSFAAEFGIPRAFGSYDELLEDPSIDAVYIPLPQHLHCEYVVKAARQGKHVLVEKPSALNLVQLDQMERACVDHDVRYMEAFMYRFKSIHKRVKDLIERGFIGEVRYIDFNWCFNIEKISRSDFRLKPDLGGGALFDLGVYGADFVQFITGASPTVQQAFLRRSEQHGVDMFSHAVCTAKGVFCTLNSGFEVDANYYHVGGETGSLFVAGSLSGRGVANTLSIHQLGGDQRSEESFPAENPYQTELEYFCDCIMSNMQPVPGFDESRSALKFVSDVHVKSTELSLP